MEMYVSLSKESAATVTPSPKQSSKLFTDAHYGTTIVLRTPGPTHHRIRKHVVSGCEYVLAVKRIPECVRNTDYVTNVTVRLSVHEVARRIESLVRTND
jgi:hypothetical protein